METTSIQLTPEELNLIEIKRQKERNEAEQKELKKKQYQAEEILKQEKLINTKVGVRSKLNEAITILFASFGKDFELVNGFDNEQFSLSDYETKEVYYHRDVEMTKVFIKHTPSNITVTPVLTSTGSSYNRIEKITYSINNIPYSAKIDGERYDKLTNAKSIHDKVIAVWDKINRIKKNEVISENGEVWLLDAITKEFPHAVVKHEKDYRKSVVKAVFPNGLEIDFGWSFNETENKYSIRRKEILWGGLNKEDYERVITSLTVK